MMTATLKNLQTASFLLLCGLAVCSGLFALEVDTSDISSLKAKRQSAEKRVGSIYSNAKPAKPSLVTRFLQQPLPNLIVDFGAGRRTTDTKEECSNNCFDQFCCDSCQVINTGAGTMMTWSCSDICGPGRDFTGYINWISGYPPTWIEECSVVGCGNVPEQYDCIHLEEPVGAFYSCEDICSGSTECHFSQGLLNWLLCHVNNISAFFGNLFSFLANLFS